MYSNTQISAILERDFAGWRLCVQSFQQFASACAIALAALALGDVCWADAHGQQPHEDVADDAAFEDVKVRAVDLGEYRIRAYYPVEAQKSTVRFVLHASVAKVHYAESRQLVESHRHKLRDQIITATRMAPLSLFDEPELTSFRRRLLVRLRRTLPELPIKDIYVSDFQLAVKSL